MNVVFTADGSADYRFWADTDRQVFRRLNHVIEDVRREPFWGDWEAGAVETSVERVLGAADYGGASAGLSGADAGGGGGVGGVEMPVSLLKPYPSGWREVVGYASRQGMNLRCPPGARLTQGRKFLPCREA